MTISRFSRAWTARRWGIDCQVISPPATSGYQPLTKKDLILSVGRFTSTGHSKKQLDMLNAFGKLRENGLAQCEYFSVGGVSDDADDVAYLQRVKAKASECGAEVLANLDRVRLGRLYGEARVFWHAAGYAESDEHPELSEHFGMATVEAMSAGCVPVVINKGGQPEIVENGVSGFLWNTLEELKGYTELLMRDSRQSELMSEAARARATIFSRERFVDEFLAAIEETGEFAGSA
jgi:glycosyltransferase involved in cell wall biosynthesis